MNKDEEYVRSVWLAAKRSSISDNIWLSGNSNKPLLTWSAAAKFTRDRIEEVRQLRASISELLDDLCEDDKCKRCIRFKFAASQLQVILTERTAGMRPEAL